MQKIPGKQHTNGKNKIPTTLERKEYTYLMLNRGEEQWMEMKKTKIPVQEFGGGGVLV